MKKLLLTAALLGAVGVTPAYAANTAIVIWNTSDPLGAETATGTGSASILSSNLSGITVSVSSVLRGTNPNDLTEANINIDNTTGSIQTLKIIAGANGYLGPTTGFTLTGTIGATLGSSELAGQFFADASNSLNGQSLSVTGTTLDTFDSGSLLGPKSFSFNGSVLDALLAPYGLAEELTLTLGPGASVFVQGVSMDATNAVPEPGTWAMLVAGFGFIAALGWKRKRVARFAV